MNLTAVPPTIAPPAQPTAPNRASTGSGVNGADVLEVDATFALLAATVLARPVALVDPNVDGAVQPGDVEQSDTGTSYARCSDGHGTLSYLFFSDDEYELARAKAICQACGLKETCLSGAVERQEPYGVWGGKLVLEGVPVEFKRGRGRPRKNPAPVLVVDEAPIPQHLIARPEVA